MILLAITSTNVSNLNTVAGQTTDLTNVTNNLSAIQGASTNATNAANSATASANSATASANSATGAASSATTLANLQYALDLGLITNSVANTTDYGSFA